MENSPEKDLVAEKTAEVSELTAKLLTALGHNLESDSFEGTPRRFAKYMMDFSRENKEEPEFTMFPAPINNESGWVAVRDLELRSMCAHHLAPFFGKCTIVYKPNGSMAGLSKFQRVVDYLGKVPTEQETLTSVILNYLVDKLQPYGIIVILEAQHTCMIVRGVQTSGSTTKTIQKWGTVQMDEVNVLLK